MPVETLNGVELRRIILRFRNQDDLDRFGSKFGIEEGKLSPLTKELWLPNGTIINKKVGKKKPTVNKWEAHWEGMPFFVNEKNEAYATITTYWVNEAMALDYAIDKLEQSVSERTKSLWYPKLQFGIKRDLRVIGGSSETKYPIYVISKGRAEICVTSQYFHRLEVNHFVVVEPQQYDDYMRTVGQSPYCTVLKLDMSYQDNYETLYDFESKGEVRKTGPGAARNFCWDDSIRRGYKAHHVIDDNEDGFHHLSHNCKFKVRTGAWIRAMEDFFDCCDNVAICGPNYSKFALENEKHPAFTMNTRIYSWLLIRNDIPFEWRGTWNEDTILSLDVLKAGWATVQFNFFLQDKLTTQKKKGGNTDEFYALEGTLRKSQMLEDTHPDVAKVVHKFNRTHHEVNYRPFADNPLNKDGSPVKVGDGINDYGVYVVQIDREHEMTNIDVKSELEKLYPKEKAVFKFNGEGWCNGFSLDEA